MPPRTRMTPEEVAASRETKRKAWQDSTGLELTTDEEHARKRPAARVNLNVESLKSLLGIARKQEDSNEG